MSVFLRVLPRHAALFPRHAALFLCALLAFPAISAAKQPDCPCWDGDRSLMATVMGLIVDGGEVKSCDQNPSELSHRRQLSQSATIVGETYLGEEFEFDATQEIVSNGPNERSCTAFIVDAVITHPLKKNQFWRCTEDITSLCRDLFPAQIEEE